MTYRRFTITIIALTVLLVVLALACLVFGSVDIPVVRIVDILTGKGSGNKAWDIIILQSRIPMIATVFQTGRSKAKVKSGFIGNKAPKMSIERKVESWD